MNGKIKILILVVVLVVGSIIWLEMQKAAPVNTNKNVLTGNGEYLKAPDFQGIDGWINSDSLSIEDLKGKVVLIDFWTYSCINCIRTLPYITSWDKKYRDKGLVIVGVHTPEFEFEKNPDNIKKATERYGIEYAVALDNNYQTWRAYQNRYWPRKYIIDKDGYIRYDHIGEGAYEEIEVKIQELLSEMGEVVKEDTVKLEDKTPTTRNTPELYLGYSFALTRGQNIGNEGGIKSDEIVEYLQPNNIKDDIVYLEGTWKSNPENMEAISKGKVILRFTASSANIVVDSDKEIIIKVNVDGSKIEIMVNEPKLYNLYDGIYGKHLLEIEVEKGFTFNSFTFG